MKNKVLALLTAAILCVNLFPLAAFAEEEEGSNAAENAVVNEVNDPPAETKDSEPAPENDEADGTGEAAAGSAEEEDGKDEETDDSEVTGGGLVNNAPHENDGETGGGSDALVDSGDAADEDPDAGNGGSEEKETGSDNSEIQNGASAENEETDGQLPEVPDEEEAQDGGSEEETEAADVKEEKSEAVGEKEKATRTGGEEAEDDLVRTLGAGDGIMLTAVPDSGTIGDLHWELNDAGVLTVSGAGSTGPSTDDEIFPFSPHMNDIKSLVVEEGVTEIGEKAFGECHNMTEAALPASLKSIGANAFYKCTSLTSVSIRSRDVEIDTSAFESSLGERLVIRGYAGSTVETYARANGYGFAQVDVIASGPCGSALTWTLYDTGTLVISGTGAMENYAPTEDGGSAAPWHAYREDITTVNVENGVASIGTAAFWNLTSVTDISIPDTVTSIGRGAFENCETLTKIDLPTNLTSIEEGLFHNCYALNNVMIPAGATRIGASAFTNCYALTDITIPGNVKNIGGGAFLGCSNLRTVTLQEGVTNIELGAFESCTSLTSITIPASVTSIGNSAFVDCKNLTTVSIPENVASIGTFAFTGCQKLTTVTIYSKTVAIDDLAFNNAGNGNLVICGYVNSTAQKYAGDNGIKFVALDGENSGQCGPNLFWTLSADGVLTILGTGDMYDYNCDTHVVGQDENGDDTYEYINPTPWIKDFSIYSSIKSIVIQDGVTGIGTDAFYGCYAAESVSIPESVTEIRDRAFGSSGLTSVQLPSNLTAIAPYLFSWCYHLTSVTIPEGVTAIGEGAFQSCEKLADFTIPAGVTAIQYATFYSCDALTSLVIPDTVQSIGSQAFQSCQNLEEVTLGPAMQSIGEKAFYNDPKLTKLLVYGIHTVVDEKAFGYQYTEPAYSFGPEIFVPDAAIYGFIPSGAKAYSDVTGVRFVSMGTFDGDRYTYNVLYDAITQTSHWKESGETASIHSTGRAQDFIRLFVDGKKVDSKYYTVTDGSTIITLTAAFLDTLSIGEHSATLEYTNGTAATTITIYERGSSTGTSDGRTHNQPDTSADEDDEQSDEDVTQSTPVRLVRIPQTGDDSPLMMWSVLFLASAVGLAVLMVCRRGRQR